MRFKWKLDESLTKFIELEIVQKCYRSHYLQYKKFIWNLLNYIIGVAHKFTKILELEQVSNITIGGNNWNNV